MMKWFESVTQGGITIGTYLLCFGMALFCGLLFAAVSAVRTRPTKSFLLSLIVLPAIVQTVITMVNGNIGTGIAVAGAFTLVRFRSAPGKASEISVIFAAMAAGIACSGGYVLIAALFSLLVCGILLLFRFLPFPHEQSYLLRITVPEDLNYETAFDDLFATYTKSVQRVSVQTGSMGTMYKLKYLVELKNPANTKEFLDLIRCRNANLEVGISRAEENEISL